MATEADLVLEDGTGVSDANTYALVATADAYHNLRGNTAWQEATPNDKATALVNGTQYIDLRWAFIGERTFPSDPDTQGQALEWPRSWPSSNLIDAAGNEIDAEEVPPQIVNATLEYALVALEQRLLPDPIVPDDAGRFVELKREKVGPIEEETRFDAGRGIRPVRRYAVADRIIRGSGLARVAGRGVVRA